MTTYFADYVNGSDANNGLGPDASHATNKPWKTLTKALGAAGIASGDTVYLSPSGPFRETVAVAMTSAVAETKVLGDPWNEQGFKTSGGVLVAPGRVTLTAYTTNDVTTASNTVLLNLAGRDHLTFERILFVAGRQWIIDANTTPTSTDITFRRCGFNRLNPSTTATHGIAQITCGFGVALNWLIDQCYMIRGGESASFDINLTTGVGSDYDANFLIENTRIVGGGGTVLQVDSVGVAANKGGGVRARNVTYLGEGGFFDCNDANLSVTFPCDCSNSTISSGSAVCLTGRTAITVLTEDYNALYALTTTSNVSSGGHSKNLTTAPLVEFGQERWMGMPLVRELGEPSAGSPLLGAGNNGSQTAYDLRGTPRPAGGGNALPAIGCFERSNTFTRDASPIGAGNIALRATGAAYYEFMVPLPASATTIAITVKWDATYAGTKPQFQVDANPRIGVAAETKTATGGSGSNETLTLSAITASHARDFVVVRVISNDTNGAGVVQADDLAIT